MLRDLVQNLQVVGGKDSKSVTISSKETIPVTLPTAVSGVSPVANESKWFKPEAAKLRETGTELQYIEPEVQEGVAISRITREEVQSEVDFWSTAVYCHILGANPPYAVVNGFLRRIWKDRSIDKVMKMDTSLFLVRFKTVADQNLVLQKECVPFDDKPMIVSKWTEDFEVDRAPVVSVWVRFPKLPLKFWSSAVLSKLASQLGHPVEMDMVTS